MNKCDGQVSSPFTEDAGWWLISTAILSPQNGVREKLWLYANEFFKDDVTDAVGFRGSDMNYMLG